jgi:hypothetical protein
MAYTNVEPAGIPELEELVEDEALLEELLEEELLEDALLDEELDELLEDALLLEEFPPDEVPPSPPHPTNRTLQASVPPNRLSNLLILHILIFIPAWLLS